MQLGLHLRSPWPNWSRFIAGSAKAAVARSGLFDDAFYCAHNRLDLKKDEALWHYLEQGGRAGLRPHPLFDPQFYASQVGTGYAPNNPLLDYLARGWRKGLRPNRWFDPSFYLATNPDVRVRGFEPLQHYVSRGRYEQRATSREFDPVAFRARFPDFATDRDPLSEVLFHPDSDWASDAEFSHCPAVPPEPSAEEWAALRPRQEGAPHIDVVMAVYGGKAETLRALHRVLSTAGRCCFEVVVVNDATPDPDIAARLVTLADRKLVTLLTNERNRGYVASANRGMDLHRDRDIVLLNADTEVFGNWIDRLSGAVAAAWDIGTATPWSNAATIMSYPITLRDGQPPLEIADEELDSLTASLEGEAVELPTAVGFCTYIRRACLESTGPFNEAKFGRGYGEENDFCRRALRKGWRHIAAANVFVRHYGGRSFGLGRETLIQSAVAEVERLHPGYLRAVHGFIRRDPLADARFLLDAARIRRVSRNVELVVGSGEADSASNTIRLIPDIGPFAGTWRIASDRVRATPNLPAFDQRQSDCQLVGLLQALGIARVNLSGSPDCGLNARLKRLAASLGAPVV